MNTSTKTTISILIMALSASPTATAMENACYNETTTSTILLRNICDTRTLVKQEDVVIDNRKKNYRERYRRISNGHWFNKHYNNKSLGEVSEIIN